MRTGAVDAGNRGFYYDLSSPSVHTYSFIFGSVLVFGDLGGCVMMFAAIRQGINFSGAPLPGSIWYHEETDTLVLAEEIYYYFESEDDCPDFGWMLLNCTYIGEL